MLTNTGNISFALYGILIVISVIAMIAAFKAIKNENIDPAKLDRMIELFKYTIVTTAISTVTLMVTDLFKERDYDKNEMEAFNNYIPYVIDTTGTLDKKINFCKFFSYVTPSGGLRTGWENYTKYLESEKEKVDRLDASIAAFTKKTSLTHTEERLLAGNEIEKQRILANLNAVEETAYLVILGADASLSAAKPELGWARQNIDSNAVIYKRGKWYRTVIPVQNSYEQAKNLESKIKTVSNGKKRAYVVSEKNWCPNRTFSTAENCAVCQ